MSVGLGHGSLCTCIGSHLFYVQKMEAPYGLMLGWIQLCSRYVSRYLHTSAYSVGDKQYFLGLGGWVSGSTKVMSCVMWSEGRKTGSSNISENLSNKPEIDESLALGARAVRVPLTPHPVHHRLL